MFSFSWLWVTLRHPSLSLSHQTVWSLRHRSCSISPSATSVCFKDLWANQGRQWTHPGAVAPRSFVKCCLGSQGTLSLTEWDCPEATLQRGERLGAPGEEGLGRALSDVTQHHGEASGQSSEWQQCLSYLCLADAGAGFQSMQKISAWWKQVFELRYLILVWRNM